MLGVGEIHLRRHLGVRRATSLVAALGGSLDLRQLGSQRLVLPEQPDDLLVVESVGGGHQVFVTTGGCSSSQPTAVFTSPTWSSQRTNVSPNTTTASQLSG